MEKCGLTLVRTTPYEGTDSIEGAEHGEVEYALTKPEWQQRPGQSPRLAHLRQKKRRARVHESPS